MRYIDREMQKNKYVARKILIVDGYNVINAWSVLKKLGEDDLESARNKLVAYVMEYSKIKGYEAHVVFDAYNVKGVDEKIEHHHDVTVVFTKENQTADTYIEKFISGLSKYDEVYVAISDYAEQQIILGKGCSRIPARELIGDLSSAKEELRRDNHSRIKKYNNMNRLENKISPDVFSRLEEIRRKK